MKNARELKVVRVDDVRWRVEASGDMRTSGCVWASEELFAAIRRDNSLVQVANVATLPGIVGESMAMPDIHWGYGFPIGGVAAFDEQGGVVSPGGVGYDINCGVRMIATSLDAQAAVPLAEELLGALFDAIPSGVGSRSARSALSAAELERVLAEGAAAAVGMGHGAGEDLAFIESGGVLEGADPAAVGPRARERGEGQLGTLGSGNHFVELDRVAEVIDATAAAAFGLAEGKVVVSIHTGSRGLGHQVCDDALRDMQRAARAYGIELPDRQLGCAPLGSKEARRYLAAMAAAANFAFANRQVIASLARRALRRALRGHGIAYEDRVLYDVAHNIAKWERHAVGGKERRLLVHRKGATRAFGPGHPELPAAYREAGQPVLIPGDMGRCSYVLAGTARAMRETFGSSCHGAGRLMSRAQAKQTARAAQVASRLAAKGIAVRAASRETLVEEVPEAYKDVTQVVEVVRRAGIALPVARLEPFAVMKG